jgi:hypothetical protein
MNDLIKDMQNKGLVEIQTICKYRGDKDLREFLKLYDQTRPIGKIGFGETDRTYPSDFKF